MVIDVSVQFDGEDHRFMFGNYDQVEPLTNLPVLGKVTSTPHRRVPNIQVIDRAIGSVSYESPVSSLQEFVNLMALAGWRWLASSPVHPGLWVPIVIGDRVVNSFDAMYKEAGVAV